MSQTQEQAKNHFTNIKSELENNQLLKEDFGPFTENTKEWNKLSLELEYHGSKIMSVIRDQSIRGMKYNQYRPDLIVCDDMEDTSSALEPQESQLLYDHFKSEIVSVGSSKTRIIVLGNLISNKSLVMRLRDEIGMNNLKSVFRAYPLLDDNGKNLWESKFPNHKLIKDLSIKSGDMWGREYLLNINVSGRESVFDKIFKKEDIKLLSDKIHDVQRKYGKGIYGEKLQTPIINQMKKFTISAPFMETINYQNDPKYEMYRQKMKEACKLFDEKLKEAYGKPLLG